MPPSTASTSSDSSVRHIGLVWLCICALGVGTLTGLGAVVLRALIALFHNLFFLGKLSLLYDSNVFDPPNPWGAWMILVPVVGGLIVVLLVRTFAPEARGHGVPEVMDAIYYKGGRIRMAVIFIKSLASAMSIGSGASVGREGPIIQIGSGIGSTVGRFLQLPTWQVITLIAAGAGSGIAATFNTPLGGVMFALELMLPEVSSRTFLPVVIATGAATYIGWLFFNYLPAFHIPPVAQPELSASGALLLLCVILGALCGVASAAFVKTLSFMEDAFDGMPGNAYTRNIVGMLLIGVVIYGLELWSGHRHVDGVGYATIQSVLTGGIDVAWFLALLFVLKLLATTISLGSGASGGIFSPSLFLGATLGGAFGAVVSALWPHLGIGVEIMALIGMAAVVGSGTGAAMTAILMIFEMTHAYATIVPSIVAVAIALGVRRTLSYENIYTIKLARRGHHIPRERHSHMFMIRHASDAMLPIHGIIDRAGISAAAAAAKGGDIGYLVVRDGNHVAGLLKVGETIDPGETVVDKNFIVVRSSDFIRDIMSRMAKSKREPQLAIVVDRRGVPRPGDILGVVTRAHIADTIIADLSK